MTPLRGDVKATGEKAVGKQEVPREKNATPAKADVRSLQGTQAQQPLKKDDRNKTKTVAAASDRLSSMLRGLGDLIIWLGITIAPFAIPAALISAGAWHWKRKQKKS